ncbi:MAG: hypothetical protein KGZ61_03965 [Sandarakinorhabdus sp.]|nr:hypothetical protein [Sandarakinorhabdus sp.]
MTSVDAYPEAAPAHPLGKAPVGREPMPGSAARGLPDIHFRRPVERQFTRNERGHATVLLGGLTIRQDELIAAALEAFGHKAARIAVPTKADFQSGKEYGNNGQCNPTYFTVGALVNHLKALRDGGGMPTERILSDFVFVTVGSCGPCRFGMYEAEYRLALRNAGFDGFRVLILNQASGLPDVDAEAGLQIHPHFLATMTNAAFIGDLLNELAFQIRPYETEPGATDRALAKCLAICRVAVREAGDTAGQGSGFAALLARAGVPHGHIGVLREWRGRRYRDALRRCRQIIDASVDVDFLRPKPVAKITGEFWAQTTEGDGNFHMFGFLEQEGAEVLVEPVATWVEYCFHHAKLAAADRRGLGGAVGRGNLWQRARAALNRAARRSLVAVSQKLVAAMYESRRKALGGTAHRLADQPELQRVGHPFYNSRCRGGEGHLEVAKNIYYGNRDLAHLVLSLKPFGCMPSTQSDGAQAAVLAHYPDMIFLPVETSGEGDVNAYSRVQMVLGEAKARCKAEFRAALERSGHALDDIRAYVAAHPELQRPLQHVPEAPGVTGRAARFVLHVGRLMDKDRLWSRRNNATRGGQHGMSA